MRRRADRRHLSWCVALVLVGCLLCASQALAVPKHGGGKSAEAQGKGKKQGKKPKEEKSPEQSPTEVGNEVVPPSQGESGSVKQDLSSEGQVDAMAGLGVRNPACDDLGEIKDHDTRVSCESSGTPENYYPSGNYGLDLYVDTGVTHPIGDATWLMTQGLNLVWGGLRFVLNLVLSLLGFAFSLNPFAEGRTMSQITTTIGRVYSRITDPWLSTLVVVGGIWFAYKGLIQRQMAAGVGGTLAAIAMLVVGLWVVHQPRESVGRLAHLSDQVALGVISAPRTGSVSRPAGSYAEAMSGAWTRLVEVPFAGLDFSDVRWALGKPPPEAVEKADEKFCDDIGALTILATLASLGSDEAKEACIAIARKRYGKPRRVIDLYLRSSPNSPSREAMWDYFNGEEKYKAKVAAQGGDGVLTRGSMLLIFTVGLLGAILLLAWLALRLFTQAAIAFVLLLVAPFALFFPFIGDSGRRAFKTWGLTLLGAIVAKVIYAAFLSVVFLGISILGRIGSPATGFLLASAFTWAVFLKRTELVSWVSIGEAERNASGGMRMGNLAAFTLARRMAGSPGRSAGGLRHRVGQWRRTRRGEGFEATRATARDQLQEKARALADHSYEDARQTVSEFEAKKGSTGGSGGKREGHSSSGTPHEGHGSSGEAGAGAGGGSSSFEPSEAEVEEYGKAKALVSHVDRNKEKLGQRWSDRDLKRFGKEDRELLEGSKDPAQHAHRIGMGRKEFEELDTPEREAAQERIEAARVRDRQRVNVADEVPGRVVHRFAQWEEKLDQRGESHGAALRKEHLRSLRRDRRARQHLPPPRRNLSRGG
jgi:hypothetical protein